MERIIAYGDIGIMIDIVLWHRGRRSYRFASSLIEVRFKTDLVLKKSGMVGFGFAQMRLNRKKSRFGLQGSRN